MDIHAFFSSPNDPANEVRALVILDKFGWIKLKENVDLIRASKKDIGKNSRNIKLIMLEAAQLPRLLDDFHFSFANGNFALASRLKLTEVLGLEETPDKYLNIVAVKTADKNKQFVKDIEEAYKSPEFKDLIEKDFTGFVK